MNEQQLRKLVWESVTDAVYTAHAHGYVTGETNPNVDTRDPEMIKHVQNICEPLVIEALTNIMAAVGLEQETKSND